MLDTVIPLQQRVSALEKRVRFLLVCSGLLMAMVILRPEINAVRAATGQVDSLTVKRLAVVDEKGTERVIIAAPLPDPMVQGKRTPRAGPIAGILIQDPNGNERGAFDPATLAEGIGYPPDEIFAARRAAYATSLAQHR